MTANGLAKLIEECGELQQVAGKRLAYYRTDEHPDGGSSLRDRMECEIADVMAACTFYAKAAGLNLSHIEQRRLYKERLFECWHEASDNNTDAIDGQSPTQETGTAPEAPEKTWDCSICGRSNYVTATHCEQCEFSRTVMRCGQRVPRDGQR